MKYLSPNFLFDGILVPPLDKKTIQLGRKKLLAELELAGGDTVDINGRPYDKNEIIRYFEELVSENALDYHNAVSKDKVLLVFLQDVQLEPGKRFAWQAIYEDPAFIRWISPYFCHSFWQLIHEAFVNSDDLTTASLLNNPLLMTVPDQEKIWTDIARLIQGEIDLLERYFASYRRQVAKWTSPKEIPMTMVADIMGYDHVRLLCLLPESRFSELRNKYAFAMMQVSIATFNRYPQHRDRSETWITNAETLAVSPQLKTQIDDKRDELRNIRTKKRPFSLRWIFLAIIVLNLIRMGVNSESDHSNNNFTPVYFSPSTGKPTTGDSMLRALVDSINRSKHEEQSPTVNPSNQYH